MRVALAAVSSASTASSRRYGSRLMYRGIARAAVISGWASGPSLLARAVTATTAPARVAPAEVRRSGSRGEEKRRLRMGEAQGDPCGGAAADGAEEPARGDEAEGALGLVDAEGLV